MTHLAVLKVYRIGTVADDPDLPITPWFAVGPAENDEPMVFSGETAREAILKALDHYDPKQTQLYLEDWNQQPNWVRNLKTI